MIDFISAVIHTLFKQAETYLKSSKAASDAITACHFDAGVNGKNEQCSLTTLAEINNESEKLNKNYCGYFGMIHFARHRIPFLAQNVPFIIIRLYLHMQSKCSLNAKDTLHRSTCTLRIASRVQMCRKFSFTNNESIMCH